MLPAATSTPDVSVAHAARITMGGLPLSANAQAALTHIEVDDALDLNGRFSLTFRGRGPEFDVIEALDRGTFAEGKEIEIALGRGGPVASLIVADITEMRVKLDGGMPSLIVSGHDLRHRLQRGRRSRTWERKRLSDVARQIAGEARLTPDVKPTGDLLPSISQANETNLSFLQTQGAPVGWSVWVDGRVLHFKPTEERITRRLTLSGDQELLDLDFTLNAKDLVDRVVVAWQTDDGRDGDQVTVTSQALGTAGEPLNRARRGFGSATGGVVGELALSRQAAWRIGKAYLRELAEHHTEVKGVCLGNPKLMAGVELEIKRVGRRLGGRYLVHKADHHVAGQGYTTEFEAWRLP